jgi:hypothetical protein
MQLKEHSRVRLNLEFRWDGPGGDSSGDGIDVVHEGALSGGVDDSSDKEAGNPDFGITDERADLWGGSDDELDCGDD